MPRQTLKPRADGRYQIEYKGKYFYGKTQKEAYAKRDQYKKDLAAGLRATEAGLTVVEYATKWVPIHKAGIGERNYKSYVRYLNILCAHIGDKKLRDVVTSDIQSVYNTRIGYSKSDIDHFTRSIQSMFQSAVIDRIIPFNPCDATKRPKGEAGTHRALEPWERDLVHRMTKSTHRLSLGVMVMLYAGLRRGEMLALDIDRDVDFDKRIIHVQEAIRYVSNQPIIGSPKTEAGVRDIPLVDILMEALTGQQGLVAKGDNGGHMTESVFSRCWDSWLNQAEAMLNGVNQKRWYGKTKEHKAILESGGELPPWKELKIRTHDFRHSYCTMLYECGVDIKSAQKWMGHADEEMTRKIYTHLSERQELEALKKLQEGSAAYRLD